MLKFLNFSKTIRVSKKNFRVLRISGHSAFGPQRQCGIVFGLGFADMENALTLILLNAAFFR